MLLQQHKRWENGRKENVRIPLTHRLPVRCNSPISPHPVRGENADISLLSKLSMSGSKGTDVDDQDAADAANQVRLVFEG